MTKRLLLIGVAGVAAVALSGCEIVLPIIALVSGNDDPPSDDYYYYEDSYTGNVDVTVEEFDGTFYGQPIEMGGAMPTATGSQDYGSAYFALTVEGSGEGPNEYEEPDAGGDWLVNAINSVHQGMVKEGDPKQVSLLGAILNQLTTFQANQANAQQAQGPQGG